VAVELRWGGHLRRGGHGGHVAVRVDVGGGRSYTGHERRRRRSSAAPAPAKPRRWGSIKVHEELYWVM
jgi:hypothetical protein